MKNFETHIEEKDSNNNESSIENIIVNQEEFKSDKNVIDEEVYHRFFDKYYS